MCRIMRKPKGERVAEIVKIRQQLRDHDMDDLEDFDKLKECMTRFVESGESENGTMWAPTLGRKVYYQFSARDKQQTYVRLKAPGNIKQ